MTYSQSVVMIVPAAHLAAMEAFGQALNYGGAFSVPLSDTGNPPATHFGLHTWATTEFTALFTAPAAAIAAMLGGAYTAEEVDALRGLLITSVNPPTGETALAHFDLVLAANGLQLIEAIL